MSCNCPVCHCERPYDLSTQDPNNNVVTLSFIRDLYDELELVIYSIHRGEMYVKDTPFNGLDYTFNTTHTPVNEAVEEYKQSLIAPKLEAIEKLKRDIKQIKAARLRPKQLAAIQEKLPVA